MGLINQPNHVFVIDAAAAALVDILDQASQESMVHGFTA